MADQICEVKTEGHSGEENFLDVRIKLEEDLQGTGITTDSFHSPRKQSVEWQPFPMQIKQEELHIKDEPAAEDDVLNNTAFPSIRANPFTVNENISEAGMSECKTVRKVKTEIPKTTYCLRSRHNNLCVDKRCKDSTDTSNYRKKKSEPNSSKTWLQCRVCKSSYTDLRMHMRVHTGSKPYKCNLCEFKSAYKSHLNLHMHAHTGEKPFKCDFCEYKSLRNSQLQTHVRTHTGEKPFKCNLCELMFAEKLYLNRHMAIHRGEKPFECDLCEFKSARRSGLTGHMYTHAGEKPYACHLCQFRTVKKPSLQIHMRSHTGEKPFQCDLCGYKFPRKSSLKSHMRIHTGEKPFQCDLCEYKSAYKSSVQKHFRTHTRE